MSIKKPNWPKHGTLAFLHKQDLFKRMRHKVFNIGAGFILVAAEDFADSIQAKTEKSGEEVYKIGRIPSRTAKVVLK